jgi:hypothetical protein
MRPAALRVHTVDVNTTFLSTRTGLVRMRQTLPSSGYITSRWIAATNTIHGCASETGDDHLGGFAGNHDGMWEMSLFAGTIDGQRWNCHSFNQSLFTRIKSVTRYIISSITSYCVWVSAFRTHWETNIQTIPVLRMILASSYAQIGDWSPWRQQLITVLLTNRSLLDSLLSRKKWRRQARVNTPSANPSHSSRPKHAQPPGSPRYARAQNVGFKVFKNLHNLARYAGTTRAPTPSGTNGKF